LREETAALARADRGSNSADRRPGGGQQSYPRADKSIEGGHAANPNGSTGGPRVFAAGEAFGREFSDNGRRARRRVVDVAAFIFDQSVWIG